MCLGGGFGMTGGLVRDLWGLIGMEWIGGRWMEMTGCIRLLLRFFYLSTLTVQFLILLPSPRKQFFYF